MQSRFSHITEQLQKEFPKWSKIRKKQDSIGAQLLNVFGLQYEDIEFYLQYAVDNYFIGTADINQADILYKASIPYSLTSEDTFILIGGGQRLNRMNSLKEFYEGIDQRLLERREVYYPNPYYIDWERGVIYFKKAYDADEIATEGKIKLRVSNQQDQIIFENEITQSIHHVWNFFDEFGLLLDTPRLYGERNRAYKERLLDVFRHPANATKKGLEYLLARELDLWRKVTWYDAGEDLIIPYNKVIQHTIEVDGNPFDQKRITVDYSGRCVLQGDALDKNKAKEVRFITGMEVVAFHDKKNKALQERLYTIDGVATPMLHYYVNMITKKVPIEWGRFIWNEAFWDVTSEEKMGQGVLPTYQDGRFLKWVNYEE